MHIFGQQTQSGSVCMAAIAFQQIPALPQRCMKIEARHRARRAHCHSV